MQMVYCLTGGDRTSTHKLPLVQGFSLDTRSCSLVCFAFSIIHRSERAFSASVNCTERKQNNENGGGLGTRLTKICEKCKKNVAYKLFIACNFNTVPTVTLHWLENICATAIITLKEKGN